MLSGCSNVTVHFPAEWQTAMSTWSNVTNGFGGTNTTVLFDLPNKTVLDLSCVKETRDNLLNSFATNNYFPNITSVDLSGLISINGGVNSAFSGCTNITSVDLSNLESIEGYYGTQNMFKGCTGLTTIDLSSLKTISGTSTMMSTFEGCTNLTSVNLSNLQTLDNTPFDSTFKNCTSLTTLSFPALKTVSSRNVFASTLSGVTGCTVHFPSNLSNYSFNLGGTNTTILYDLPATA